MSLELLLSGLVVFVTHALEAITGFGCTVLALPFVTSLLGLRTGVLVLTAIAWLLALWIALRNRASIDFRQFGIIAAFVLVGLPVGIVLFRIVDQAAMKKILAAFIVVASSLQLAKALGKRGMKALPKPVAYALLVAGGIVHGMFSSGGPFVVLYAASEIPDKGRFRATLCLLWATLNTIILAAKLASGDFGATEGIGIAAMLPFLAAGYVAGEFLHARVNAKAFSITVFSMLLATGAFMLFL